MDFSNFISQTLGISSGQVAATLKLMDEGATIPFISRYRKEATGSLDEVQVAAIFNEAARLQEVKKRKEVILKSIEEQGALTEELRARIAECYVLATLEDIYLPYKPKRRTRATIAREKGLEPLAEELARQTYVEAAKLAQKYATGKVASVDEALEGARDIIAEWVNENETARRQVRNLFEREATISATVARGKEKEAEGAKYRDYFAFSEPLHKCPSHRLLALRRGEAEGFLRVSIAPQQEKSLGILEKLFVKNDSESAMQVKAAITDSYKRLLSPSIETEVAAQSKGKADGEAIRVFADNLRQLLLSPPLGQKNVLAIDPGFRTGCKVVCLDAQGNLRHNATIYPHAASRSERVMAAKKMEAMVEAYKVDAIAIGNGTAGRETEDFVKELRLSRKVQVFVVSEDGASIYSASPVAREEFPEYDVTVRGAASIGRRLMDPLAELVKIDPKSIGVGQYQHDVNQQQLKRSLDQTVESCVNLVGVNLNTASKHLLAYVSGLGAQLAENVVSWRREHGAFASRKQLREVPRLGVKAFEQCAGFLRISNPQNPLDNSAVHPENYHVVEQMAKDVGCSVGDLLQDERLRKQLNPQKYVSEKVGLPTLLDIMKELAKPGLDPREHVRIFEFAQHVHAIEDLQEGMILPGIVTNITAFGAFVDVGIKQDGLVHISQLADAFVNNPNDIVKLHQHVQVRVVSVDADRKRIQLSMKGVQQ
ncbi:MAG: RNA-binding transcriptional accessory protein [Prevotellaceae bacterium]|nr:RNA-binding transcriptional accessory protein [Prevotellaceae bacterium]